MSAFSACFENFKLESKNKIAISPQVENQVIKSAPFSFEEKLPDIFSLGNDFSFEDLRNSPNVELSGTKQKIYHLKYLSDEAMAKNNNPFSVSEFII